MANYHVAVFVVFVAVVVVVVAAAVVVVMADFHVVADGVVTGYPRGAGHQIAVGVLVTVDCYYYCFARGSI
jgi:uncharacterized YccA/Bax inhibitor family protein